MARSYKFGESGYNNLARRLNICAEPFPRCESSELLAFPASRGQFSVELRAKDVRQGDSARVGALRMQVSCAALFISKIPHTSGGK